MPPKRQVCTTIDDSDSDCTLLDTSPSKKFKMTTPAPTPTPASRRPRPLGAVPDFLRSVSWNPRFDFFPPKSLDVLAEIHKRETDAVISDWQLGRAINPKAHYKLVSSIATGLATEPRTISIGNKTPSVSHANARLLHQFLADNREMVRSPEKTQFVNLKSITGMSNPDFAHMHSVRYGEVGLGFDMYGCLSLYTASIEKGVRQAKLLYVERFETEPQGEPEMEPQGEPEMEPQGEPEKNSEKC